MIIFKDTDIIGFASIPNEKFYWDKPGLNIIQAPNGYGKSKFIDALCWSLYGSSLSGSIEPWSHKRKKDFNGTKVETTFEVHDDTYKVIRCKDYKGNVLGAKGNNRLELLCNGEKVKTKGRKEVQVDIVNLLGYSFNLFINSIIFGQKIKRLITETGPNKKKIFEEAFEMSYIPRAKKLVDDEKKSVELTYYKQKSKVQSIQEKIDALKEALKSEQRMIDSFEENKNKEIEELSQRIKKNNDKILLQGTSSYTIEGLKVLIKEAEKNIKAHDESKINKSIGILENKISTIETILKEINESITNKMASKLHIPEACPNCNKKFTKSELKDEAIRIYKDIETLKSEEQLRMESIREYKGQLKELNSTISSIKSTKESILSYNNELKVLESIKNLSDENKVLKSKIDEIKQKSLKNSTKKYRRDIRSLKKSLKPEKELMLKLKKDLEVLNWLIDDPLSNTGLKAFIFNRMLDSLNSKLTYYSKFIPFKVLFDLDMDSHHKNIDTYVMDGDNPVPFEDLSGGQQQAVNIATAFAVHDIVSEGKICNLLIMDELFESLDKDNVEIMSELIQDKAKDKSLFLITHNPQFSPTNANIININYKHGFTSID